jgi:hypothetical protein
MKVDTGIASKPSDARFLKMGDLVTIHSRNQENLYVVVAIYSPLDVNVISLKDGLPYTVYRLDLNLFEGTAKISNDL